jgi:LEA14-like dessication related protein
MTTLCADTLNARARHRHLIWALVILMIPACTSMVRKTPPRIQVADIQPGEVKALEANFLVTLRVINPNDTSLTIKGLSCDLTINGRRIASGVSSDTRVIPPYETGIMEVSVYSSVVSVAGAVIGMFRQAQQTGRGPEKIDYELSGKLNIGGLSSSVPFSTKGQFSLSDPGRLQ